MNKISELEQKLRDKHYINKHDNNITDSDDTEEGNNDDSNHNNNNNSNIIA